LLSEANGRGDSIRCQHGSFALNFGEHETLEAVEINRFLNRDSPARISFLPPHSRRAATLETPDEQLRLKDSRLSKTILSLHAGAFPEPKPAHARARTGCAGDGSTLIWANAGRLECGKCVQQCVQFVCCSRRAACETCDKWPSASPHVVETTFSSSFDSQSLPPHFR
jgi:hypothetical protein